METFRSIYTPDVVHHQPGHNKTSGEYKGVDNVLGLYGQFFELSGGTMTVDLTSVKTQGDKVVTVHHTKAERDGKTLDADENIEFNVLGRQGLPARGDVRDDAARTPSGPSRKRPSRKHLPLPDTRSRATRLRYRLISSCSQCSAPQVTRV